MHHQGEARLPPDEHQWARRVRAGDVTALEEAFRTYYSGMCSFVHAQVGSPEVAEDLVQDVFLRVWQSRTRLEVTGSLRALLYRSAHNAALNYLKHRNVESRWLHAATTSQSQPNSVAADPASVSELNDAIDSAVADLPERCRLIFMMSRQQGLSYPEIANALGLSIKTVETQMGRALKALRSRLSPFLA